MENPAARQCAATIAAVAAAQQQHEARHAMPKPVDPAKASRAVRAVFDDIKKTRNVPEVNNFWKYLARDPALLERTWTTLKATMAPGALDPLVKEMIYLAVSVSNGCTYCIASHTAAARKAGMTEAMFGELMAVVGMANETNRLANGYRVPVDAAFED
jgi:AhpD family alkylhydroperoxidase